MRWLGRHLLRNLTNPRSLHWSDQYQFLLYANVRAPAATAHVANDMSARCGRFAPPCSQPRPGVPIANLKRNGNAVEKKVRNKAHSPIATRRIDQAHPTG